MTWPIYVEPGTGTGGDPPSGGSGPIITPIFPPVSGGGGPVTVITPGHPPVVVDPRTGQQFPANTPTTTTVTVHPDGTQTTAPTAPQQPSGLGGIGDLLQIPIFGIPLWIVGLGVLIIATGKK